MSWLFGPKKLVPRVPFPQAQPFDEKALTFSSSYNTDRIIEPEAVKAAAGVAIDRPTLRIERPIESRSVSSAPSSFALPAIRQEVFVKVETYQQIIAEMDSLKSELLNLSGVQKKLESSEYFEEEDFEKMQRSLKSVHDSLARVDKRIFNN